MKHMTVADVPEGWEIASIALDQIPPLGRNVEECRIGASVILRRVHVWPESVLQYAALFSAEWLAVDPDGTSYLYTNEPTLGVDDVWTSGGVLYVVPSEWAPPHDHTGDGWRKCKWRLPVEDTQ